MTEMKLRNYSPDILWMDYKYRGKKHAKLDEKFNPFPQIKITANNYFYQEHDINYMRLCISNIFKKVIKKPKLYSSEEVRKLTSLKELSKC
jgi:uncharacterized protein (TIGR02328 family)